MAYQPDVDAIAATLELTIDYRATSLTCAGQLDAQARRHVLEAVEELLELSPSRVTIDVRNLEVSDSDAANTLIRVQRRGARCGDQPWRAGARQRPFMMWSRSTQSVVRRCCPPRWSSRTGIAPPHERGGPMAPAFGTFDPVLSLVNRLVFTP